VTAETTTLTTAIDLRETHSDSPHSDARCDDAIATPESAVPSASKALPVGSIFQRGVWIFVGTVAAFLVWAFLLSGLVQGRDQIGLQRRFRNELSSELAPIGGAIAKGAPVAIVQSKAIGLDQVIVEGSRSTQLRLGPGHVVGSSLPGQPGNAVIAGRRTLYGGPFGDIGSLHEGERIRVTTGQGIFHYTVTGIQHLSATDGSLVQDHGDNRLTLFTSDSSWSADGRLVVTAKLVGQPAAATVLQRRLDADGLGLTGERDAAPNLLVWLELLAVAGLVTAYFASRWSAARTWLVCAPVLALLLWQFFAAATRLLPATL
jgi:sortase A